MGKRNQQGFLQAERPSRSAAKRASPVTGHPLRIAFVAIAGLSGGCVRHAVLYAGPLRPVAGACNPVTRAEMTIRGSDVLFIPSSGTLVLHGVRTGDSLTARNASIGADRKPYNLAFKGQLSDDTVQGVYDTPRCRYEVTLRLTSG